MNRVESEDISYLSSLLSTLTKRVVRTVPKKIPMRQCLGCREMKPKMELIRVDFKGKLPGRGAYLCPNPDCLKKARKARALERAFSAQMPDEVWSGLEEQMKEVPTDG